MILDLYKMDEKQSETFHTFLWHFFPRLKQNFIAYRSSKVSSHPDCIFEIRQLWQSGFSRMYSNCCCSCSFESEIIKISQSSHKIYSNNILNSQESTTILNACTKKKVWKLFEGTTFVFINPIWRAECDTRSISKRSLTGLNSEFSSLWLVAKPMLKKESVLLFTLSWRENNWIHTFPESIRAMWNAISLVLDLNSCHLNYVTVCKKMIITMIG